MTNSHDIQDDSGRERRGLGGAVAASLILAVVICVAYLPSMRGAFLFDDKLYVVQRPHSHLEDLSWERVGALLSVDMLQPHRWLSHLSFGLNYYFFGEGSTSFHVVNVAIHLLTTWGVGLLTGTMLRSVGWESKRARRGAFVAACVFGLHPIQTQAVSYIWQRTASLVTMWVVWGMWCFAQSRGSPTKTRWIYIAGAVLCGVLAPLTKQNGILLPPLMWLYHLAVVSDRSARSIKRHLAVAAGVAALGLVMAMGLWVRDYGWEGLFNYSRRDYTMAERLMTQPRVILLYLKLIALPLPTWLNIDHGVAFSTSLFSPWTTLPAIVAVLGAIGFGIWSLGRWPLVGLSVLWFFLCHVPESTVMPLELVFEHRNYMPMVGFAWLAALAMDRIQMRAVGLAVLAVVSLGYAGGTYVRNGVYRSEWSLFEDAHRKSPHLARPTIFLAEHLKRQGKYDEALALYAEALRAEPTHPIANHNMGVMLAMRGQYGQAIKHYRAALAKRWDYPSAHNGLGNALFHRKRFDEALEHYEEAVRLQPKSLDGHLGMAMAYQRENRLDEALASCQKALAIAPDWPATHFNLGLIQSQMGRTGEAIESYRRAIKINPAYTEAHSNLGQLYVMSGRIGEGLAEYRKALAIEPHHAISQFGLATGLAVGGQYDAAIDAFRKLLTMNPKHGLGYIRLGMLLAARSETNEAITSLQKGLRLVPDVAEAYPTLVRLLTRVQRYDEAIAWANRRLKQSPQARETLLALGEALLKVKRANQVVQRFEPMLAEPDGDGRMHALVGDGLAASGREREAIRMYRKGLTQAGESPALALALARVLAMSDDSALRDGAEAESLAKYAAEASGHRSAEVLSVLAAAHAEAGHFEQAVRQAKKAQALAIESHDAALAEEIGRQLDRYAARKTFQRAKSQSN